MNLSALEVVIGRNRIKIKTCEKRPESENSTQTTETKQFMRSKVLRKEEDKNLGLWT